MALTDRMLIGAIANNPAVYEGAGEYRCCRSCETIFFTSAANHDATHDAHDWFALPSLNPDNNKVLVWAFKRFISQWPQERQEQLEKFASRKGWDMAMELKYGGGALEESEVVEWQEIINGRLSQLLRQARAQLEGHPDTVPTVPSDL